MSQPFLGEIRMVGFTFAPKNWAACDGAILSISQHAALFALLGTYYGGNGTSTFALPDMRSRVPVDQGLLAGGTAYTIGERAGSENQTLLTANLPSHSHQVAVSSLDGTTQDPTNAVYANGGAYSPTTTGTSGTALASTGNSTSFSLLKPYQVVMFTIALTGLFPSRN